MKKILIKLTIAYQLISILAAAFIGMYQWYENDRLWLFITIMAVAIPMMATYTIVLAHVMKAISFIEEAETKERMHEIRNLYPVSKGDPVIKTSTVKNDAGEVLTK